MGDNNGASPSRTLSRISGIVGGGILLCPVMYLVLSASARILLGVVDSGFVLQYVGPWSTAAHVLSAIATAFALAALGIDGPSSLRRTRFEFAWIQWLLLVLAFGAISVVVADRFVEALTWGVNSNDPLVAAIGVLGIGAVVWMVVRAARAFTSGYSGSK